VGCVDIDVMQATTAVKQTVLCSASSNVDTHAVLCALEDVSVSSTEAACLSQHNLLDFAEFDQVEL